MSRLETNFNRSPSYSIYKSFNHKRLFLLINKTLCPNVSQRNQSTTTRLMFYRTTTRLTFYRPHQFFSESQNHTRTFEMPTRKPNSTCFEAYLYSAGIQHGNLHQLSATTSRVTCFILRACTGTGVCHNHNNKNSGEGLEKCRWMAIDRAGRNQFKEEIPGSRRSKHGYILTYSRLWR